MKRDSSQYGSVNMKAGEVCGTHRTEPRKRFCASELRVGMDSLQISSNISPKRAKLNNLETLFRGMRGMHVDDNLKRKVVYLGQDDLSDAMRVVLGSNKDIESNGCDTLAKYRRNDWKAYLSKIFRCAFGDSEEVWLAAPADDQGKGGQIFRISFRRHGNTRSLGCDSSSNISSISRSSSSSTSSSSAILLGSKPMSTHSVDDMTVEEFAPGSVAGMDMNMHMDMKCEMLPNASAGSMIEDAEAANVVIEDIESGDDSDM